MTGGPPDITLPLDAAAATTLPPHHVMRHRTPPSSHRATLVGAALVVVTSCTSRGADANRSRDSAARATGAAPASTSSGASGDTRRDATKWRVSALGIGPVVAGMSFADAAPLLGLSRSAATGGTCAYVRPVSGPAGVSLMVRGGEIARVQVDSGDVRTTADAGIGDGEARIDSLYRGQLQVGPHKYTGGHYMVVKPTGARDSRFRIVFETDGQRVTRYRAGRLPEVEWVEGCG